MCILLSSCNRTMHKETCATHYLLLLAECEVLLFASLLPCSPCLLLVEEWVFLLEARCVLVSLLLFSMIILRYL